MRLLLLTILFAACGAQPQPEPADTGMREQPDSTKMVKSDQQWKEELTDAEYHVLRQKGTERAFSGDFWDHKEAGTYVCAGCELPLFSSKAKFRSGTGWPSYYEPISDANVAEETDLGMGMIRTEVLCARCGGHLGHVFSDGPHPTGMRYCINSISLDFLPSGNK